MNMTFKITKKEILKLASNADVYRRGYRYYEENRVGDITYEEKAGRITGAALVDGNYKDYPVKANFDHSGVLTSFHCGCEAYTMWKGACKHVVCLLLKIQEEAADREKRDEAEHSARGIITAFEERMRHSVDHRLQRAETGGELVLLPSLSLNEKKRASLSFSLGPKTGRMYVIKNIGDFMDNIRNENFYSYGKELAFKHHLGMFDKKSKELIGFIDQVLSSHDDEFILNSGKRLYLAGKDFDDFFPLFEGEGVEADMIGHREERLFFVDGSPKDLLQIQIDREIGRGSIQAEGFDYFSFSGYSYGYFACNGYLHRMEKEECAAFDAALYYTRQSENGLVSFEGAQYPAFMSIVLPQLIHMGLVQGQDQDKGQLVAEAMSGKVYLDMDNKDIVAKVVFVYGEEEIYPGGELNRPILRDGEREYEILRCLGLSGFVLGEKGRYVLKESDGIYQFIQEGIHQLRHIAEVYVTDSFQGKTAGVVKKMALSASISGNLLEMKVETGGYSMLELFEAVNSFNLKKRYHRFKDGGMLDLGTEDAKALSDLVNSMGISSKEIEADTIHVPAYRALYVDQVIHRNSRIPMEGDENFTAFVAKIKGEAGQALELPKTLEHVLREYQKEGVRWLSQLANLGFGGILADDMGLGKTLQVIALLLMEKDRAEGPSLVVAPTSLMYNWQKEIARFAPELQSVVLSGPPGKRQSLFQESQEAHVLITTYDILKRDIAFYGSADFHMVIADEAQYIKNPLTQNARAIKKIKSRHRFALTGTPIENSLSELWSIFDFIMPGYLYSSARFAKLFETPIIKEENEEAALSLKKQTAPFILRRIKKDVLKELPDKTQTTLYADLREEQRKLYTASFLKAKGEFESLGLEDGGGLGKNKMAVIAELTRLRQLCCHPELFIEGYHGGSGKLDITMETIEQALDSGHRILLFSQFTSMLAIIKKKLDLAGYTYFYLDGATPSKDRSEMAEQFNGGERDLFLVSLKAGGTGLNLTGADIVIHYDQWWNPAVMDQASDRAHRFGQKRAVQVYNIVAKDTIEEKIMALQERKKDLMETVLSKGGSFLSAMSEEELGALFQ